MSEVPPAPQLDERRLGRWVAIGLPLLTIGVAVVVGLLMGPATSILVCAAGILLGVIAMLWSSLRILSGDVALSPEIEALDMAAQGVDALASRKKMLLRALKDLENEHAIGKIEDEDFEQLSVTYRSELKTVLVRIDDTLAPHRTRAEEAARAHLRKAGLLEDDSHPEQPSRGEMSSPRGPKADSSSTGSRVMCPTCGESNEPDAKFCKGCATKLSLRSKTTSDASLTENTDDTDDE